MDHDSIDSYFELLMDLPEAQRAVVLARLDREQPALARDLRGLLAGAVTNGDFACSSRSAEPAAAAAAGPDTIHQVTVQVDDVAAAVAWYRSVFACELLAHDGPRALLRFGNICLALVTPEHQPPGIAVLRPDLERFGRAERRADGSRGLFLVDPWGNSIEIVDRRPS